MRRARRHHHKVTISEQEMRISKSRFAGRYRFVSSTHLCCSLLVSGASRRPRLPQRGAAQWHSVVPEGRMKTSNVDHCRTVEGWKQYLATLPLSHALQDRIMLQSRGHDPESCEDKPS